MAALARVREGGEAGGVARVEHRVAPFGGEGVGRKSAQERDDVAQPAARGVHEGCQAVAVLRVSPEAVGKQP